MAEMEGWQLVKKNRKSKTTRPVPTVPIQSITRELAVPVHHQSHTCRARRVIPDYTKLSANYPPTEIPNSSLHPDDIEEPVIEEDKLWHFGIRGHPQKLKKIAHKHYEAKDIQQYKFSPKLWFERKYCYKFVR